MMVIQTKTIKLIKQLKTMSRNESNVSQRRQVGIVDKRQMNMDQFCDSFKSRFVVWLEEVL